jgi:hypothetical protein
MKSVSQNTVGEPGIASYPGNASIGSCEAFGGGGGCQMLQPGEQFTVSLGGVNGWLCFHADGCGASYRVKITKATTDVLDVTVLIHRLNPSLPGSARDRFRSIYTRAHNGHLFTNHAIWQGTGWHGIIPDAAVAGFDVDNSVSFTTVNGGQQNEQQNIVSTLGTGLAGDTVLTDSFTDIIGCTIINGNGAGVCPVCVSIEGTGYLALVGGKSITFGVLALKNDVTVFPANPTVDDPRLWVKELKAP